MSYFHRQQGTLLCWVALATCCCVTVVTADTIINADDFDAELVEWRGAFRPNPSLPVSRSIFCEGESTVLSRGDEDEWKDVQLVFRTLFKGNVSIETELVGANNSLNRGADTDVNIYYDYRNGSRAYTGFSVARNMLVMYHIPSGSEWITYSTELPFDSATAYHNYTLEIISDTANLLVDGNLLHSMNGLDQYEWAAEIRLMTHCITNFCELTSNPPITDCSSCGRGISKFRSFRVQPVGEEQIVVPLCVEPQSGTDADQPNEDGGDSEDTVVLILLVLEATVVVGLVGAVVLSSGSHVNPTPATTPPNNCEVNRYSPTATEDNAFDEPTKTEITYSLVVETNV